jgi:pimeloyl-ACP methyl ester carboxylesterase
MRSLFLILVLVLPLRLSAGQITPPTQPTSGPGGSDYQHAAVRTSGPHGKDAQAAWIFESNSPTPKTAPIIVFLHGYTGVDSRVYGGWIEHLVRRGNTVIYPVYQTSLLGAEQYSANAMEAIKEAFRVLRQDPDHVRPHPENHWAIVGHSLGCPIGANIAATAQKEGLPKPLAFMACNAGDANSMVKAIPSVLQSPQNIPDLLMLVIVGDDDKFVGETTGRAIFEKSTNVKPEHKNLIHIQSDPTGSPALKADHFAPLAMNGALANGAKLDAPENESDAKGPLRSRIAARARDKKDNAPNFGRSDTLDFYGYWKWFDALTGAAFHGTNREYALGDTPEQKFIGKWSNGTLVKPATVETAK